jgi:hypothetical protein
MVALYVAETGLGDSVLAGTCTSVNTLVTAVTAACCGFIKSCKWT